MFKKIIPKKLKPKQYFTNLCLYLNMNSTASVAVNPSVLSAMTFEACFDNFVYGGLRNWLWMLPSMVKWPDGYMSFFSEKMDVFRAIHNVIPVKAGYPDL